MAFVKGDPRINRKGRPKGPSVTEELKKLLKRRSKDFIDPKTGKVKKKAAVKAVAEQILEKALEGDKDYTKMLWHQIDGAPKQQHEVHGDLAGQLTVRYEAVRPKEDDTDE